MKFADGLVEAYKKKWSFVNSFTVHFNFDVSVEFDLPLADIWKNVDQEQLQLHILSINTPQFTNQAIEVFQADRWRIHNGRDEMYRFTINFRDSDQMGLYRKWLQSYRETRLGYFDQVKFSISLYKDADWEGESAKRLFEYNDVIIENVSQIDFNTTTENQVAEFSVGFKCLNPDLYLN